MINDSIVRSDICLLQGGQCNRFLNGWIYINFQYVILKQDIVCNNRNKLFCLRYQVMIFYLPIDVIFSQKRFTQNVLAHLSVVCGLNIRYNLQTCILI